MPKTPIGYSKSIIYKICCKDPEIKDIYIGSTTNFRKRKYHHKCCCNNIKRHEYNYNVYKFIRDNGNWENWDMVMIEEYKDCESKLQLQKKERYYIETLCATLNKYIPLRTKKEYYIDNIDRLSIIQKNKYQEKKEYIKDKVKKYRNENKEKIKMTRKKHYEQNKENILTKNKIYRDNNKEKLRIKMSCICGSIFNKRGLTDHMKTKKHIKYLENNNE